MSTEQPDPFVGSPVPPYPGQMPSYPDVSNPSGYAAGRPAHQGMAVSPKSPAVSLLASFFIPGLGSMINGDVGKGIGILIGYVVSLVLVLVIIGILGVFAFWIVGMIDAYQGAKLWNARHGLVS
jgi:TM2 domain-containing membrane protein YozV